MPLRHVFHWQNLAPLLHVFRMMSGQDTLGSGMPNPLVSPKCNATIAMVSTKVLVVKRQAMLSTTTVHRIQCIFCSIISAKVPHDAGKYMYKMPCWATKCDVNNLIVLLLPLFAFAGNTGGGGNFQSAGDFDIWYTGYDC